MCARRASSTGAIAYAGCVIQGAQLFVRATSHRAADAAAVFIACAAGCTASASSRRSPLPRPRAPRRPSAPPEPQLEVPHSFRAGLNSTRSISPCPPALPAMGPPTFPAPREAQLRWASLNAGSSPGTALEAQAGAAVCVYYNICIQG
jgi:hypothetical protein